MLYFTSYLKKVYYYVTRVSLLCVTPNTGHQTICLIFSVFRPRWKSRQQQVCGKKLFLGHIVPGNFGGKAAQP